jgi:hypothetical protein
LSCWSASTPTATPFRSAYPRPGLIANIVNLYVTGAVVAALLLPPLLY